MHKGVYQTAIGCGIAWLSVAALEFFEVPSGANPWLTSTIACIMFAVTSSMIYNVFWRSYTPYITLEEATILASSEALPAPPRARFWLAVAMLFSCACVILVVIGAIYGKPVWSSWRGFESSFFISITITVSAMFQKSFNKILPPRR